MSNLNKDVSNENKSVSVSKSPIQSFKEILGQIKPKDIKIITQPHPTKQEESPPNIKTVQKPKF